VSIDIVNRDARRDASRRRSGLWRASRLLAGIYQNARVLTTVTILRKSRAKPILAALKLGTGRLNLDDG